MSDQSQTTANTPSEPVLCKLGCGFFVSWNERRFSSRRVVSLRFALPKTGRTFFEFRLLQKEDQKDVTTF